MKNKIHDYLKKHGGSASSLSIVRSVLRMQAASLPAAEAILRPLLADDPLFLSDGMGTWHLNPIGLTAEDEIRREPAFFCVQIDADQRSIALARRVSFAWVLLSGTEKVSEGARVFDLESGLTAACNAMIAVLRELPGDGVIISWHPARFRGFIQRLGLAPEIAGKWEADLGLLVQNVLDLPVRPRPEKACRLLGLSVHADAEPLTAVQSSAEVLTLLLQKMREHGALSLERILAAAERRSSFVSFERYRFKKQDVKNLPEGPGVYLMRDGKKKVIYVGKAKNLRRRVQSYFKAREHLDEKLQAVLEKIASLDWKETDTELDALLEEARLIERHKPEINTMARVHVQGNARSDKILILPTAGGEKAIVWLLGRRSFLRMVVPRRRLPRKKLLQHIDSRFFSASQGREEESGQERDLELIFRFCKQHADQLLLIDPADFDSAQACQAAVVKLLEDFDNLQQKQILRQ